ncbi:guanine-1-methyltransferase-domain-containing protein [Diaporthe sp. PMI_573]|jgi:tRNA (guanine9-N1)-methyltransferase|nr:guanine-1-methyltransferase-domain-containing protein [Diaporthaceae sp. PMI_573]
MEGDGGDKAAVSVAAQTLDTNMTDASAKSPDTNPRKRARDDAEDDAENEDEPADDNSESKPSGDPADGATPQPKISKNQLKKLKRRKVWEQKKEDRKAIRKDKRHEKSARRRLERDEKAAKLAEEQGIDKNEAMKQIVATEQKEPKPKMVVPISFIIDCDFEKYMREPELVSLGAQITRCYAMNRAGQYQARILVSSWGGFLKQRFETVMQNTHLNYKGVRFVDYDFVGAGKTAWDIMHGPRGGRSCPALGGEQQDTEKESGDKRPTEGGEGAPKVETSAEKEAAPIPEFTTDSIVYLSADSPNVLEKLEPHTSYVIGGLVDRNREKLLCQKRAEEKGIRTAKLPIGDYMVMASRQVLATNHVVEIMSKWLETGDWGKAFQEVIPKRKGGQLKGENGEEGEEEDGKDDEVEAGQSGKQDELDQKQHQQGEKQEEVSSEAAT